MNILFYTSFNERSIAIESAVCYFLNKGDNVFFVTTCSKGSIHNVLEEKGVRCFGTDSIKASHFSNISFLISFCKKHQISIIHSHLQLPNFYSSIAQFFIKSQLLTVRHNSDVVQLYGTKKEIMIEKLINKLSPRIIAISDKVKKQLLDVEGVKSDKIYRINNGYDFKQYETLSLYDEYVKLKAKFQGKFVLLSPGRLILSKRHQECIHGLAQLVKKYPHLHLIIIGDGPDKNELEKLIQSYHLFNHVSLIGYKENIIDYIKIADVVVQLSSSEASNNTIKEAAYFNKTCIACENVGDFSDYMVNRISGFLLQKENPTFEFVKTIEEIIRNPEHYTVFGEELKKEVIKQFDIVEVGRKYDELHDTILK